jgi:hypothetical protein
MKKGYSSICEDVNPPHVVIVKGGGTICGTPRQIIAKDKATRSKLPIFLDNHLKLYNIEYLP